MSAYSTPKSPYMRRFRVRFTDCIYVHIPLSAHGFATTDLSVNVWDRQGRHLWYAYRTINPATYCVTVAFVETMIDFCAPRESPRITAYTSKSGLVAIDGPSLYRGYPYAKRRRHRARRRKRYWATWKDYVAYRRQNPGGV
jgi:hypothetical protein